MKIDKGFVLKMSADAGSDAIVRSILDLARNMGLTVVAEGVEDRDTWSRLQRLGCAEAQGYYMARPLPAADVATAVTNIAELALGSAQPAPELLTAI